MQLQFSLVLIVEVCTRRQQTASTYATPIYSGAAAADAMQSRLDRAKSLE
jgi:hypothetical protein